MSDNEIIDITQLAGKFKNRAELQQYAEKLFHGLKAAVEKLQAQEQEIEHLKTLLANSVPKNLFVVPDEQAIAEVQLKRLKEIALDRELTLDETKRYDLLNKNLILAKGKKPPINAASKNLDDAPVGELIEMVKHGRDSKSSE
jgi:hypothetical protein